MFFVRIDFAAQWFGGGMGNRRTSFVYLFIYLLRNESEKETAEENFRAVGQFSLAARSAAAIVALEPEFLLEKILGVGWIYPRKAGILEIGTRNEKRVARLKKFV